MYYFVIMGLQVRGEILGREIFFLINPFLCMARIASGSAGFRRTLTF